MGRGARPVHLISTLAPPASFAVWAAMRVGATLPGPVKIAEYAVFIVSKSLMSASQTSHSVMASIELPAASATCLISYKAMAVSLRMPPATRVGGVAEKFVPCIPLMCSVHSSSELDVQLTMPVLKGKGSEGQPGTAISCFDHAGGAKAHAAKVK